MHELTSSPAAIHSVKFDVYIKYIYICNIYIYIYIYACSYMCRYNDPIYLLQ